MRKKLALTLAGLAAAAVVLPVTAASASCGPDLSAIGGPSCTNLCPKALHLDCVE